jgi:hypothetical protein
MVKRVDLLKTLLLAVVAVLSTALSAPGQPGTDRITAEQYIEQWKAVAVKKMKEHGIPASITLAQGLLESGNGNSELARKANNHFGIKCTPDWTGGKSYHDDDAKNECFRKYNDAAQSYEDHAKFLQRSRYASLFELKPTDYKGWAHGLKKAGYATADIYVPREVWANDDPRVFRVFLASMVQEAVAKIVERFSDRGIPIAGRELLADVEAATQEFLAQ